MSDFISTIQSIAIFTVIYLVCLGISKLLRFYHDFYRTMQPDSAVYLQTVGEGNAKYHNGKYKVGRITSDGQHVRWLALCSFDTSSGEPEIITYYTPSSDAERLKHSVKPCTSLLSNILINVENDNVSEDF